MISVSGERVVIRNAWNVPLAISSVIKLLLTPGARSVTTPSWNRIAATRTELAFNCSEN